jgi:hypothetical protein
MNVQEFLKNRSQFPADELLKYAGKHVAWSPDGTKIIASADDLLTLDNAVKGSGYPVEECVVSAVPATDALIGGGSL